MTDRFSSRKELKWHRKAYDAGMRARSEGKTQFEAPRLTQCGKWYRDSWLAGWDDSDQAQLSESQTSETGR